MKKVILTLLVLVLLTACMSSEERIVEQMHMKAVEGIIQGDSKKASIDGYSLTNHS